ncbi:MAG: XAC2610-related protein [Terriglobia bacterium]
MSQLPPGPVPGDDVDFRGGVVCRFVINPKLPVFTFRFVAQGDNPLGKIEISEGGSKKIVQIIPNPINPYFADIDPLRILKLVDANFDGYNDFAIREGCGVTGNSSYDFYLYDPAKNQFVHNSFLSNLVETEFDPESKQVKSVWNMSAGDWGHETYRSRWSVHFDPKSGVHVGQKKDIVTEKTYELQNGKMQLTNSRTHPLGFR